MGLCVVLFQFFSDLCVAELPIHPIFHGFNGGYSGGGGGSICRANGFVHLIINARPENRVIRSFSGRLLKFEGFRG